MTVTYCHLLAQSFASSSADVPAPTTFFFFLMRRRTRDIQQANKPPQYLQMNMEKVIV